MIDEKKLIESLIPILNQKGDMYLAGQIIACIDLQPKTDWIPCEVELPPKPRFSEDSYLVKTQCVTTPYTAYWNGEKWTDVLDDDIDDVVAWRPIPPYKKEGAE